MRRTVPHSRGTHSSAQKKMANCRTLAIVMLLLVIYSSVTLQLTPAQRAERSVSGLYDTIRSIASPNSANLQNGATTLDGRFILMMPGKVLNYQDYHPGPEYTEFIQVSEVLINCMNYTHHLMLSV